MENAPEPDHVNVSCQNGGIDVNGKPTEPDHLNLSCQNVRIDLHGKGH